MDVEKELESVERFIQLCTEAVRNAEARRRELIVMKIMEQEGANAGDSGAA